MKKILIASVPRSATTLIFNILKEIVGEKYAKPVHSYVVTYDKIIIPYRDFRDCIISRRRLWGKREGDMSLLEIFEYYFWIKRQIKVLKKYSRSGKNILWLKYEDFVNDFDFIYDNLEEYLDIKIPKNKRDQINKKFSFEALKKKTDNLDNFEDEKTTFFKDHLATKKIQLWKQQKHRKLLYFLLRRDLILFGYGYNAHHLGEKKHPLEK